mgnify:CR=1 FL=1
MTFEINEKLDEVVDTIRNNEKVKRMKELKNQMYSDKELSRNLEDFRKIQLNSYSSEYVEKKKKILENEYVKEYKVLENELYFTVLEINKRLNTLLDREKCEK